MTPRLFLATRSPCAAAASKAAAAAAKSPRRKASAPDSAAAGPHSRVASKNSRRAEANRRPEAKIALDEAYRIHREVPLGHPAQFRADEARLLANRLNAATSYLVDLKRQFAHYGDHMEMVGEVLETLLLQQERDFQPGSDRDRGLPQV